MEAVPIWVTLLGICGGIVTILSAIEKIANAGRVINEPNKEQDRRIASLEGRCDAFDRYLASDKQRLNDLEASFSVLMKVQIALLGHAINGNDTDKLKEVQAETVDYLSKRGIHL